MFKLWRIEVLYNLGFINLWNLVFGMIGLYFCKFYDVIIDDFNRIMIFDIYYLKSIYFIIGSLNVIFLYYGRFVIEESN